MRNLFLILIFITVGLMTCLSSLHASPIAVKWDKLSHGDNQQLKLRGGAELTIIYKGRSVDGRVFEHLDPATNAKAKIITDELGQIVRHFHWNGSETRFYPNDCSRTIGYCTYRASVDGSADMIQAWVHTIPTATGYEFIMQRSDTNRNFSGEVQLTHSGLAAKKVLNRRWTQKEL
jgi:hypothetical protein